MGFSLRGSPIMKNDQIFWTLLNELIHRVCHEPDPAGIDQPYYTVLQIQVYPKKNAPGVSKPPRVAKSDFLLILKIFLTLDDIRPGN